MKTLRLIGIVITTAIVSINFTACSDDKDENEKLVKEEQTNSSNTTNIVGKWKVEHVKSLWEGIIQEFDYQQWCDDGGYPFRIFTDTLSYGIDNRGNEVERHTYTYNANTKIIRLNNNEILTVLFLSQNKMKLKLNENIDGYDEISYLRVN